MKTRVSGAFLHILLDVLLRNYLLKRDVRPVSRVHVELRRTISDDFAKDGEATVVHADCCGARHLSLLLLGD